SPWIPPAAPLISTLPSSSMSTAQLAAALSNGLAHVLPPRSLRRVTGTVHSTRFTEALAGSEKGAGNVQLKGGLDKIGSEIVTLAKSALPADTITLNVTLCGSPSS